jgi:hypothetical protein
MAVRGRIFAGRGGPAELLLVYRKARLAPYSASKVATLSFTTVNARVSAPAHRPRPAQTGGSLVAEDRDRWALARF